MKKVISGITAFSFLATSSLLPVASLAQTSVPQGYKEVSLVLPIRFAELQKTYRGVTQVVDLALYKGPLKGCDDAGGITDKRDPMKKYFCNEWPIALAGEVISPSTGKSFAKDASLVSAWLKSATEQISNIQNSGSPSPLLSQLQRSKVAYEANLNHWKSSKIVIEQPIEFVDFDANQRAFGFQLKAPRTIEASRIAAPNLLGGATEEERTVSSFIGKQTVKTHVVAGNLYQEICFFHPQIKIGGMNDSVREGYPINNTEVTIKKGIIEDDIHVTLNPGQFSASSVEYCSLVRLTAAGPKPGKIELVAVDTPKFNNASIQGLEVDVSGISFWTSLVAMITATLGSIVAFFATADFNYLLIATGALLGAAVQVLLPGIFNVLEFVVNKMIGDAVSSAASQGESYLRTGKYIQDVTVAGTVAVGSSAVANNMAQMKAQKNLTAHMDPKMAISEQCMALGRLATSDRKLIEQIKSHCYGFGISLRENSDSKSIGCYDSAYLVQAESATENLKSCKVDLVISGLLPSTFEEIIECIGDSDFNKTEAISACLPVMSQHLLEIKKDLELKRIGIETSAKNIAATAESINLVRGNEKLFSQVEKFLKGVRGASYDAHEAVAKLKELVANNGGVEKLKESILNEPGLQAQLDEVYQKYMKRAATVNEKKEMLNRLSNSTFPAVINSVISRARSDWSSAVSKTTMAITGVSASAKQVSESYNSFISSMATKEQLIADLRVHLAQSEKAKAAVRRVYKQIRGTAISDADLNSYIARLASGDITLASLKAELKR
jgi:hypothetical protein